MDHKKYSNKGKQLASEQKKCLRPKQIHCCSPVGKIWQCFQGNISERARSFHNSVTGGLLSMYL